MSKRVCVILMLAAVAGLAVAASGQLVGSRTKTVATGHPAQVARLPYTAEYKISNVSTLANGATITHEATEVMALDSEGRRMNARTEIPASGDQTARTHVWVSDPVARTTSTWDSPGRTATVSAMAAPGTQTSCPPVTAQQPSVEPQKPVVEDLGTETILGVEARGHRTTFTIQAGKIGNNEPLTRIDESWSAIAPGLRGLVVRQSVDNPQSGKMEKELVSLNQSEPDAAVFQPPAGYEIVNKSAPQMQCAAAQPAVAVPSPQ
jgi:hypothetical protein